MSWSRVRAACRTWMHKGQSITSAVLTHAVLWHALPCFAACLQLGPNVCAPTQPEQLEQQELQPLSQRQRAQALLQENFACTSPQHEVSCHGCNHQSMFIICSVHSLNWELLRRAQACDMVMLNKNLNPATCTALHHTCWAVPLVFCNPQGPCASWISAERLLQSVL